MASLPFLATVVAEDSPIVLSGVLLTLVVIYLASKLGAEVAKRFDFPPVLGELVAGVIVGVDVCPARLESACTRDTMVILTTFLAPPFLRVAFGSSSEPIPEPSTPVETTSE